MHALALVFGAPVAEYGDAVRVEVDFDRDRLARVKRALRPVGERPPTTGRRVAIFHCKGVGVRVDVGVPGCEFWATNTDVVARPQTTSLAHTTAVDSEGHRLAA